VSEGVDAIVDVEVSEDDPITATGPDELDELTLADYSSESSLVSSC